MMADNYLRLRTALAGFKRTPAELTLDERAALEAQVARASALERKVLADAAARDVHVPAAVVEQAVQTLAARYGEISEFHADLARNDLDPASLRSALERELKVEAIIDKLTHAHCQVGEDEVAIYYYQHQERFLRPEVRTVRHILITINNDYPDNSRSRVAQRIAAVREELLKNPAQFDALARKYSECPTALEGGRIGRVKRGMLYPQLDAVLFAMEVGGISAAVESELGLHLLWCEAVTAAGPIPLAEARARIVEVISARKRKVFLREWLKG